MAGNVKDRQLPAGVPADGTASADGGDPAVGLPEPPEVDPGLRKVQRTETEQLLAADAPTDTDATA